MYWLIFLVHLTGGPDADYLSGVMDPTHYENLADCNHVLAAYAKDLVSTRPGQGLCLAVDPTQSNEIPLGTDKPEKAL